MSFESVTNTIEGRNWRVIVGDSLSVLRTLPEESVHCCVTSPPYWNLRNYNVDGQIGLEKTPSEFIDRMIEVFDAVRRVLRSDGTLWMNMGDSYASGKGTCRNPGGGESSLGKHLKLSQMHPLNRHNKSVLAAEGLKPKDRLFMPHEVAIALRNSGWYARDEIIWAKRSAMPESVTDRTTKSHELIFLFSKSPRYFYDAEAVKEPCSESTHARLSQDVAAQVGSKRANGGGKTNGVMKAVIAGSTRKLAEVGSGTKNNRSYNAAMVLMPETRNLRSVWWISSEPYSDAHFATFPSELPRRCIMAGTSEKGCCAACGAPWRRIVERKPMVLNRSERTHSKGRTRASGTMVEPPKSKTTGWKPTCTCDAEIAPCVVLDCFSGSGTTGMVATELGRHYVGIELNPEYAAMSANRIESWKFRDADKQPEPLPGQMELFS